MDDKDFKLICGLIPECRPEELKVKKAGGQTNRNYIVRYGKKAFFVRLPWERNDILDRKAEARNILAITQSKKLVGVVPKYLLYVFNKRNILFPEQKINFSDGTSIMEYIEGKDIDGKELKKSENQIALLKSLSEFHKSRVKFANSYDVFRDEVSKYKKKAEKYPIEKLISKEKIKKIGEIEKTAESNFPLGGKISTHNDLIFENLRLGKNGRIYLLDFEYAGFNIRSGLYYDLGIILGGNLFQKNPIQIKTFEQILKKAEKIYQKKLDKKKIYFGALINVLVMFWWGLVKYFSSATKKERRYFKSYILKRTKGIELLYQIIKK